MSDSTCSVLFLEFSFAFSAITVPAALLLNAFFHCFDARSGGRYNSAVCAVLSDADVCWCDLASSFACDMMLPGDLLPCFCLSCAATMG